MLSSTESSMGGCCSYLKELYGRYGKPIWLTEFSCCLNRSGLHTDEAAAKQITFARRAMKLLDSLPYVKRYSVNNTCHPHACPDWILDGLVRWEASCRRRPYMYSIHLKDFSLAQISLSIQVTYHPRKVHKTKCYTDILLMPPTNLSSRKNVR